MAREDMIVAQWFEVLGMLKDCASNLNHDTENDVAKFYAQKHADILNTPDLQHSFAFCVFRKTGGVSGIGISITDDDFQHTAAFHELLDAAFRPLRNSVRALFRRSAIDSGSVTEDTDPIRFEGLNTTAVYRSDDERNALVSRSKAVMPTLSPAVETALRKLLTDPNAAVKAAIDSTL